MNSVIAVRENENGSVVSALSLRFSCFDRKRHQFFFNFRFGVIVDRNSVTFFLPMSVQIAVSAEEVRQLEYDVRLLEWQSEYTLTKELSDKTFESWVASVQAKDPNTRSIFVSIPSYRDEECPKTLLDLYTKASFPQRIFVGIYQQNEPNNVDCLNLLHKLPKGVNQNIQVMRVSSGDAQGPTHARAQIQQHMFRDQDYFMAIDSHMMFTQGWDVKCISQLHHCDSVKSVLTTYPLDFDKSKRTPIGFPMATCIRLNDFDLQARMPRQERMEFYQSCSHPLPTIGYAAGFNFSPGVIVKEVPYDAYTPYLFLGEESLMALRMYTAGYDLYCPNEIILFHLTTREYRPLFWEQYHAKFAAPMKELAPIPQSVKNKRAALKEESLLKVQTLLSGKTDHILAPYGLGMHRNIEEYFHCIGVNYDMQTVFARSKVGLSKYASNEEQMAKYGRSAADLLGIAAPLGKQA